jgi:GxxExxY protein
VFAVHGELGPGFDENVYRNALMIEFEESGLSAECEKSISLRYRKRLVGKHRLDVVVEGRVILELKSVEELCKRHYFQLRSYLRAAKVPVGLLINFNENRANIRRVETN